jgi:hypothetical protein
MEKSGNLNKFKKCRYLQLAVLSAPIVFGRLGKLSILLFWSYSTYIRPAFLIEVRKIRINSKKSVLTARILIRSNSFWRTGQVEDDQLGFVGLGYNHLVEFDGRMHSTNVRGFPT